MQSPDLHYFASLLHRRKEEVKEQEKIAEGLEKHTSLRDSTQELSTIDNHPADLASEIYERGKDLALHEKESLLKQIDDALLRIEEGTFGLCTRCHQAIPRERLEAIPYTNYCLPCRQEEDRQGDNFIRPIEEKVLETPFDRTYMDERDSVIYDGEDTWEDVARHNKRPYIFEDDLADEEAGIVEEIDKTSNDEYQDQLPN